MTEFLDEHAELVAEIEDPHYGSFVSDDRPGFLTQVYRVDWDSES